MLRPDSLLLYKNRPARLLSAGDRLEIEVEGGGKVRVRPKDVVLLHPGPLTRLADLQMLAGEVHTAWEILAGEPTSLSDLAELIYGRSSPSAAWSAWQHLAEGLYFTGTPDLVQPLPPEEVARRKLERDLADASRRAWKAFMARTRGGEFQPADRDFLRETENLALGRGTRSQVLRDLGRPETPESAHALLLELGVWDMFVNPYPVRQGITLAQVELAVPEALNEERRDLTHLPAFAIDDEGSDTPDDAISLEVSRLWVHVADPAAVIPVDSPLDLEARERSASLHLPEGTIHLLPREVTRRYGLGLQETSPALSFGIDLDAEGSVLSVEIVLSHVRVTRLTYAAAELLMDSEPLRSLEMRTNQLRERRRAGGAVMLDFPEVRITLENTNVQIHPLPPLRSRAMVEEAMIQTGIQAARFAADNGVLLPFSQQEAPDQPLTGSPFNSGGGPEESLSAMFAARRLMKRSRYRTSPQPHSGLGAAAYAQVTSPLRRYLDLVAHQQLRAFLKGEPALAEKELLERIGAVEAASGSLRLAEVLSEKHWTLVYLLQNPGWRSEGILVEKRGTLATILVPSLALEVRLYFSRDAALDTLLPLKCTGVDLPRLDAMIRVES